jgi:lysozyme
MTLTGIDISKWNGDWNAAKAKSAGASFAYIKASQASYLDPNFLANYKIAKASGIYFGAYHYMDYTRSVSESANFFVTVLNNYPCDLPPVVDYEQNRTDNNIAAAKAYLRQFLELLRARGYKPVIYTSSGFWGKYGENNSYWAGYPLWLAQYVTKPTVPKPWNKWTFWQYSSTGKGATYGTESFNVDLNRFNGDISALESFAGIRRPSTVELENRITTLEQRATTIEQRITTLEQTVTALKNAAATTQTSNSQTSSTGTSSTTTQQPDPGLNAICMALGLNVRSGPANTYPVVGGLVSGQRIKVLERQNGWARFESPAGWSSEQYLKFT